MIGCSQTFFKQRMELQLNGDMTRENYVKIWQIDHTTPVASFNLFNEDNEVFQVEELTTHVFKRKYVKRRQS